MKKHLFFGLISLSLISCKKTWTCNCTITTTTSGVYGNGTTTAQSTSSIPDQKKSDAEKICEDSETNSNNYSNTFNPQEISQNASCSLAPN